MFDDHKNLPAFFDSVVEGIDGGTILAEGKSSPTGVLLNFEGKGLIAFDAEDPIFSVRISL